MTRSIRVAAVLVIALGMVSGCEKKAPPRPGEGSSSKKKVTPTPTRDPRETAVAPDPVPQEPAATGDFVAIDYTGTLDDGTEFDTSRKAGRRPLGFTIGRGEVVPGMEQGVVGMKVGESRRIVISPEKAYGPVNRDLVTEMSPDDLREIKKSLKGQYTTGEGTPVFSAVARIDSGGVVLEDNHVLVPGDYLAGQNDDGSPFRSRVTRVDGRGVRLDNNHRLAGKTLTFDVTLTQLKKSN